MSILALSRKDDYNTAVVFLALLIAAGYNKIVAPVAQADRAPASGAGCERSSRSRGVLVTEMVDKVEIRWHGRGGQGAVTSAELVAQAAINEGKYAQAFPSFTPERRGAPVLAFNRIDSEQPIRTRAEVDEPDVVIVLDSSLLSIIDAASGLKKNGTVIINTKKSAEEIRAEFGITRKLATVDATRIAQESIQVPIVNTTMIGALLKVTNIVKLETMNEPLEKRFGKLAERNFKAMERAYQETLIGE